jgi:hypothetical protein
MVNAVTKSGTNQFTGSLGAYFRDSDWNAEDHVLQRKVPFENQQISVTGGGPIVRDPASTISATMSSIALRSPRSRGRLFRSSTSR